MRIFRGLPEKKFLKPFNLFLTSGVETLLKVYEKMPKIMVELLEVVFSLNFDEIKEF